jgi:hypothetical protein
MFKFGLILRILTSSQYVKLHSYSKNNEFKDGKFSFFKKTDSINNPSGGLS